MIVGIHRNAYNVSFSSKYCHSKIYRLSFTLLSTVLPLAFSSQNWCDNVSSFTVISILFLLLQTTHNIALLPFCIPVLPSLAVFEHRFEERSNPENTASSFYFPRRLWKNIDIGFPSALPIYLRSKYNMVSHASSSLPILIPHHFPRRHICISVKLDANVAVNYLRSNSRQRGLTGYINLRDRTLALPRSPFYPYRSFLHNLFFFLFFRFSPSIVEERSRRQ